MKFFIFISALLICSSLSNAHSCVAFQNLSDKEFSDKLREVDQIFEGEIIAVTGGKNQVYQIKYKVIRAWKGIETAEATVEYANPCSSSAPQIGSRWTVYSYKTTDREIFRQDCCRPFDDERMKRELGIGKIIETVSENAETESVWSRIWKAVVSFFS